MEGGHGFACAAAESVVSEGGGLQDLYLGVELM